MRRPCHSPGPLDFVHDDVAEKTIPDGKSFTNCDAGISFSKILQLSLEDSTPLTPIFFILSPGADPVVNLQEIALPRLLPEQVAPCVAR